MSGLHFYKLDLHTHTPASNCYLEKSHTPEQIIQAALERDLAAIAITDHNTAAWIDRMKTAADGSSLVIFPGVEISLNEGFHMVALFDPSVGQKYVESFLGYLNIKPEEYGKSDAVCKQGVYDVIDKIHEWKGLAVLAHIDSPKGAFFEQSESIADAKVKVLNNCSKLFNDAHYDAIESVAGYFPKGYDEAHHFTRTPALYQASDNPDPIKPTRHSLDGIGSLYTWFRVEQLNLEGLRLCFRDPGVRILLMNDYHEFTHPHIKGMRVGNSGFLRNLSIDFHEGLNSLIGGKGVGKSLVVEFLRFGLSQPPEDKNLLEDHNKKLATRLELGNRVEILYQLTDGSQYKIERQLLDTRRDGNLTTSERCWNLTTEEEYHGDIPTMFPILAYSQTEVIKIAENKNAQLQLIDRFINPHPHEQAIEAIRKKLGENDQRLNTAIIARDRLASVKKDLDTLETQIKAINKFLDNPLFETMKQAEGKKQALDDRYEYIGNLIEQLREWQTEIKKDEVESPAKRFEEDSTLKHAQAIAEQARTHAMKALEGLISELGVYKNQASEVIMSWMPQFDQLDKDYKNLLKEIGGDREARERERKRLDKQKADYEKEAKDLLALIKDLDGMLTERTSLLDKLERAYYTYYEVRKEKYDQLTELSDGKLQVDLTHAADRTSYEEMLVSLLKGGAGAVSTTDRRKIAQNVMPRRFVQLVLDRNIPHLANEADISETWAERVIDKLWAVDDFCEVLALQHSCYPTDVPSIRFHKEGGVYGELNELSVGQKCTALLIIALCDGSMPIVIDQPEDALDIASVWEDVAKKLRRGKDSRQFILTTHNSSVAVGSDSDQFIILKAGATSGRVIFTGAIDRSDVRQSVIDHLEGGDEPYKLRAQKYNIQ